MSVDNKKKGKKLKKQPVAATMLEKATRRAQEKNCVTAGNNVGQSNPFTILLNNTPNDYCSEVMLDLDLKSDNIDTTISAFKAEEIVRAALAEANYRSHLCKLKEREGKRGGVGGLIL